MTMTDAIALVAGVAMSFAMASILPDERVSRTPWLQLVASLVRFLQSTTLAIAFVGWVRVGVYRRMPTSAEWLAILVGSTPLFEWPYLRVDSYIYAYRGAFASLDAIDLGAVRWIVSGLFLAPIAIGLGVFQFGRSRFPTWFKTVLLAWIALVAESGPLEVFGEQGANLFAPEVGFGPGTAWLLMWIACGLAAWLPMGIAFGLPATATMLERLAGKRWTWAEWACFLAGMTTLFSSSLGVRVEFRSPSIAWFVERALMLGWVLAAISISRVIIVRLHGRWDRWTGSRALQDRSSPSGPDSPESTR